MKFFLLLVFCSFPPLVVGRLCLRNVVDVVDGGFESTRLVDPKEKGWKLSGGGQKVLEIKRSKDAFEGRHFVELNLDSGEYIFQDLPLPPREVVHWTFAHRARNSVDTIELLAGPPDGPLEVLRFLGAKQGEWKLHTGRYETPAGQTVTRVALRPVTSGGNFVDDVHFGQPPCVEVDLDGLPTENAVGSGEVLTVTVDLKSQTRGVEHLHVSTKIPDGFEYVRESMLVVTESGEKRKSDRPGDDGGAYDAAQRVVTVGIRRLEEAKPTAVKFEVEAPKWPARATFKSQVEYQHWMGSNAVETCGYTVEVEERSTTTSTSTTETTTVDTKTQRMQTMKPSALDFHLYQHNDPTTTTSTSTSTTETTTVYTKTQRLQTLKPVVVGFHPYENERNSKEEGGPWIAHPSVSTTSTSTSTTDTTTVYTKTNRMQRPGTLPPSVHIKWPAALDWVSKNNLGDGPPNYNREGFLRLY